MKVLDAINVDFASGQSYYYLVLLFVIAAVVVASRIRDSRVGDAFVAIRDNEIAAEIVGIDTYRYKLLAFALSAFFAAVSGSLYAHYMGIIVPSMADIGETMKMLLMIVLGGSGVVGVTVSAMLVTFLPEWMRFIEEFRTLLYGGTLILILIFLPKGLPEAGQYLLRYAQNIRGRISASPGRSS